MRGIAFDILLFYICLNLALGFLATVNALPGYNVPPASTASQLGFFDKALSYTDIASIAVPGAIGGVIAILMGHALLGGAILVITAAGIAFPIVRVLILGFPTLLSNLNVPSPVVVVLQVLTGLVWLVFFAEFLGGREVG